MTWCDGYSEIWASFSSSLVISNTDSVPTLGSPAAEAVVGKKSCCLILLILGQH